MQLDFSNIYTFAHIYCFLMIIFGLFLHRCVHTYIAVTRNGDVFADASRACNVGQLGLPEWTARVDRQSGLVHLVTLALIPRLAITLAGWP